MWCNYGEKDMDTGTNRDLERVVGHNKLPLNIQTYRAYRNRITAQSKEDGTWPSQGCIGLYVRERYCKGDGYR